MKAIETIKKEGGHAQAAMSYTISPVHTNDVFADLAKEFAEMGADSSASRIWPDFWIHITPTIW